MELGEYKDAQQSKHKLFEETMQLKRKIYEKYPTGGCLHIVLEDGNLENHYIEDSLVEAEKLTEEEDRELFIKCASNLLIMTRTQRKHLYLHNTIGK